MSFELGVLLPQLWVLRFDAFYEQVLQVPNECLVRDFDPASSQVWKHWGNVMDHEVSNHQVGRMLYL